MTPQISPQEWEALSAYLDGELNTKERNRLETRLEKDKGLSKALEGLRQTRTVLRSQSKLHAPRNFTLTSEMAGIRSGLRFSSPAYPVMRLAFALATFFFIVISAGNLVAGRLQPMVVSQSDGQREAPLGLGGGGGGGGGGDVEMPAQSFAAPIEPSGEATPTPLPMETETGKLAVTPMAIAPETLEKQILPSTTVEPTEAALIPPGEEPSAATGPSLLEEPQAIRRGTSVLNILQILLAVLAVSTGIATYLIRRSTQ
jgi:hypothetical protein